MHRTLLARLGAHRRIARMAALLWITAAAALPGSAALPPKAFSQVHSLVSQSLQQYHSGNRDAALNSLKAAQGLVLKQPTQFSSTEKQRLATLINKVAVHHEAGTAGTHKPWEAYRKTLVSLDPLQHPLHQQRQNEPTSARSVLQTAWKAVPKPTFVTTHVAQFGRDFRAGANSSEQTLINERNRWLAMHLSHANAKLIDDWLATPPDRRVFVIGSRDDEAHVERLRQRYPELVFGFYQDCKPLCRESTIGALFGSSKNVISIESPHAETSLFIPVEIGMAKAHLGSGKQLMLIDTDEARRLLNSSGSLSLTSTLVSCSLDAILRDEAACL